MLIEVINYDNKNVGTPSSKSWTLWSHGSLFFAIAGTETENVVELSGSNFYQIYNISYRIYTVIPIYLYCLINIDQMYVIVIKLLFL